MTPFLTVSFAILPQHDAMKKRGERLPFLLSTFLIFYFQLLLIVWLKRLSGSKCRATTWRKRRHQRREGEWGGSGALIIAPHEPIYKVQLHARRSSEHSTPKEEGCRLRCYSRSLFRFLCLLILLILLCRGRLIESRGTVRTIAAVLRTMRRHSLPLAPITHLNFLRHGLLSGTFFSFTFRFQF